MFRQNKMRARCLIFVFSLSITLAGCSGGDIPPDLEFSLQGTPIGIKNSGSQNSGAQGEQDGASKILGTETVPEGLSAPEVLSLQELPDHVFRTEDGHLLLLGDTILLVDSHTMEVEKRNENPDFNYAFRNLYFCKMTELAEEYLVLGQYLQMKEVAEGMFSSEDESRLIMVRLGKNLEVKETVDVGKLTGCNRSIDGYELIDNGTKLICSSLESFFLYDMQTKKQTTYFSRSAASGPQTKEAGLRGIFSFGYEKDTDKIIFTGAYYDGIHDSYLHTIGSVRPDGTELKFEKEQSQEWGDVWCFDHFALIEDQKLYSSGEKASVFYLGADGTVTVYSLADEYTAVQPSDKGNYFAVQSKNWDAEGNHAGYTVRIYASDTGALLQEILCPLSEIGSGTALYECIICEDAGKILLLMCDRETKNNARLKAVAMK